MTLGVPPQGLTIKDRFFKTDTVTQPNGAIDLTAGKFPVLGLAAPTFLGSVFVDVTSVNGVRVEVGDRTRTSQGALTFESSDNEPGIFSLQAPPDESELTPATTPPRLLQLPLIRKRWLLEDRIRRAAKNFRPFARRDDGSYGDLKAKHRCSIERRRSRRFKMQQKI